MSAIVGKQITEEHRSDGPMVPAGVRAREPFLYAVHPHKWPWDPKHGDHLPKLNRIPITPGCGGVDKDGNDSLLKAGLEDHDFVVIRANDPRLGKYKNYTYRVPHAGGANYVVSKFEMEGKGSVESIAGSLYIDKDLDAERKFKLFLIRSGMIQPLNIRIRKHLIMQQEQRLTRVQGRAERSNSAALKIKLKREQALLEKMRAAYDQARNPRKASKASKAPAEDGAVL